MSPVKLIGYLSLGLWLGLAALPPAACAAPLGGGLRPNGLLPSTSGQRPSMSAPEAARVAQQRNNGGTVLSVDPVDGGYRVKLLKNGDVRVVYVSGQ